MLVIIYASIFTPSEELFHSFPVLSLTLNQYLHRYKHVVFTNLQRLKREQIAC